eukprot:599451-Lingulodinium_polyedra.AAC.1
MARAWSERLGVATHLRGDALRERTRHCVEQNLLNTVARPFAQCVAAQMRGDALRERTVGARLERGWSTVGSGWSAVGE